MHDASCFTQPLLLGWDVWEAWRRSAPTVCAALGELGVPEQGLPLVPLAFGRRVHSAEGGARTGSPDADTHSSSASECGRLQVPPPLKANSAESSTLATPQETQYPHSHNNVCEVDQWIHEPDRDHQGQYADHNRYADYNAYSIGSSGPLGLEGRRGQDVGRHPVSEPVREILSAGDMGALPDTSDRRPEHLRHRPAKRIRRDLPRDDPAHARANTAADRNTPFSDITERTNHPGVSDSGADDGAGSVHHASARAAIRPYEGHPATPVAPAPLHDRPPPPRGEAPPLPRIWGIAPSPSPPPAPPHPILLTLNPASFSAALSSDVWLAFTGGTASASFPHACSRPGHPGPLATPFIINLSLTSREADRAIFEAWLHANILCHLYGRRARCAYTGPVRWYGAFRTEVEQLRSTAIVALTEAVWELQACSVELFRNGHNHKWAVSASNDIRPLDFSHALVSGELLTKVPDLAVFGGAVVPRHEFDRLAAQEMGLVALRLGLGPDPQREGLQEPEPQSHEYPQPRIELTRPVC